MPLQRQRAHSCDALGARARPRDRGEDEKDGGELMNISPADSQSLILTSAPPADHRSASLRVSPLQAASGGLSVLLKQSTLQTLISTPRQNVPLKLLFGGKSVLFLFAERHQTSPTDLPSPRAAPPCLLFISSGQQGFALLTGKH